MTALLIFVFIVSSLTFDSGDAQNFVSLSRGRAATYCLLPAYPEHGSYAVSDYPAAKPGESYPSVLLDVSCDTEYLINNNTTIFCINGYWSASIPKCVRFCRLVKNLSVEYRCELSGPESVKDTRECDSLVPSGTVVTPICRSPEYFSLKTLEQMHCIDGSWNYNPICKPACGITSKHRQLEGTSTNHPELPWHAVIYRNVSENYMQICGGSLISSKTVISAAHCFWDDLRKLPASDFVVAVGKLYRPYKDIRNKNSQQSNVVDIGISPRFQGAASKYHEDIAIVIVEKPFQFLRSVRPVCLDFDDQLGRTQLTEGSSGKAVGWTIGGIKDQSSPVLTVVDLPFLKIEDCYAVTPMTRQEFITSDKFCAGTRNGGIWGASFCKGDSGGGLAFLEPTTLRYYLRGVLSVSLVDEECSTINTYSSILKHEHLIKQFL